ncbi:MAG: helix-turn-helix domain-containing protein [Lachnospiraceae bacterium]|nr:helix-turn-helix domain-containing protein [Lachnospiraceae bacterium]
MHEYLERIMHQSITERPYDSVGKLPLGCRNAFELTILGIQKQEILLATPIDTMNLTELRKMRIQLERYTGYRCVFYLKKANWYSVPKMVEEGIPFIWEDHQIYLPFLGVLLQKNEQRTPKRCSVISFLTQKLLLKALYENWQNVSAVQAAEKLEVSRMSITRCFDEIEALGMPFLKVSGRSRRFFALNDKKSMWEEMRPFLRNPVIREFRPERKPDADMVLSGISALEEYSMLGEDNYVTYAVGKDQVAALGLKSIREVPVNEEPVCIVQEVGYLLPFKKGKAVDPLSLTLILSDEELEDPRVESCMNEMLEELVW